MSTETSARGKRPYETRGSTAEENAYWFYGDLVVVHVSGAETDGRFCVVEFLQPAGEWTPLHVHRTADQAMYMLEGELTFYLPGKEIIAGAGQTLYGPRDVPHTEHVTSQEAARVAEFTSPAGFDEFIVAAGEPAAELTLPPADWPAPDVERLAALAAEHEIEILGPPGALP